MDKRQATRPLRQETGRWARVPVGVIEQLGRDGSALAVYACLASHGDRCWPHQATVAAETGLSVATVERAVQRLRRAGLITVEARLVGGRKVGNVYTLDGTLTSEGHGTLSREGSTRTREPLIGIEKRKEEQMPDEPLSLLSDEPGDESYVPSLIDQVFTAWRDAVQEWRAETGLTHSTLTLTPSRKAAIRARLKEGYPVDELVDAVRGWRRSPFHCGGNDKGKVYNSIELICRSGEKVEQFRDLWRDIPMARPVRVVGESKRSVTNAEIARYFGVDGQRP